METKANTSQARANQIAHKVQKQIKETEETLEAFKRQVDITRIHVLQLKETLKMLEDIRDAGPNSAGAQRGPSHD